MNENTTTEERTNELTNQVVFGLPGHFNPVLELFESMMSGPPSPYRWGTCNITRS